MAQSNGHSSGKAALSLDQLRKLLRDAQGDRTKLENNRVSAIAERDRLETNYLKLLREGGDLDRAYTKRKVANDLVDDLATQIADAEAKVTSIQFQISDIEAAEQREQDFVRRQEIAERRDAIRGEIAHIWQSAATKENELSREADTLAAELQAIQARAPRAVTKPCITNPEPLLRMNGRLVHA
jgi:hypothetical protein